ncbi:c-type cytochrome [Telmatobacter bradus]|uniref:c-type cytochrome n=1 Tax=Telmatobacter bradus TaxID=474953 RepID=UPI003B43C321
MLLHLSFFLFSAVVIYAACEYFVNAVEWCGSSMQVGTLAMGSLLAAFGTALPESLVTLVTVVFGHTEAEKQLGVGAAMGGPLVLATVAYAVVGLSLLFRSRSTGDSYRIPASRDGIRRDQSFFLLLFLANLALGLTNFAGKRWLAFGFVAAYLVYVWKRAQNGGPLVEEEALEPLKLHPDNPTFGWAAMQFVASLVVITLASKFFVGQLGAIGAALHFPPQLAALLLSPLATELPETMNAILWVRQGKTRLALANISGAMMIQTTIPAALGIFFTSWHFDYSLRLSALITLSAILFLWLTFLTGWIRPGALVAVSLLYLVFGGAVISYIHHRWQHVPAEDHAQQNPVASQPEAIAAGQRLFGEHCSTCHQTNGNGRNLTENRLHGTTDGDLEWFLRQGDMGQGMPSWNGLSQNERWQLVSYLRTVQ